MATVGRNFAIEPFVRRRPSRWTAIGVGALFASKFADALTTTVGLLYLSMHEANPVMRWLFAEVSVVPGLVISTLLVVVGLTAVTEAGAALVVRFEPDRRWVRRVRYVGYGVPSLVFTVVATHNLVLITSVL